MEIDWIYFSHGELACEANTECEITGHADYDDTSEARKAQAAGTFRYWFVVRFSAGEAKILLENSEVIRRG